ncbi:helix-turn-helix transcriptional regulator [Deinococcus budaensis]|uniref:AraC-like DNA-binding protein n=1 Tax=Deinococcus budaensis TaxID=1665626 RepID=A0A7W8GIS7_9DEIO|nr:AraC family transcriptional regulator [Deinococcus budaensis]MBB5236310.1 AraC-like DNA-binding protein [Deinococcus budaensis]
MSTTPEGPRPPEGGLSGSVLLTPRPFLRVWRPGGSAQLELVWAQQGAYDAPAHFHEDLELSLSPLHPRTLEVGGRSFNVPPAAVSVVLPGELHRTRVQAGGAGVFYSVRIHASAVHEVWQALGPRGSRLPRFPVVLPDPALAQATLRLHRLAGHAPGLGALALETHLWALLALLFRSAGGRVEERLAPPPSPAAVAAAREQMERSPGLPFTLTSLADGAGLSASHFARVFRRATGFSPHAYLLDARVRRAKALLGGEELLAQLALGLGFSSQSHFAQVFRQRVGVSPLQFRQDSRILVDREWLRGASSRHDEP